MTAGATLESVPAVERTAAILRCLGHPLRLRLLQAIGGEERSVSELQECTGEAQATVSRQLAVLRARRVVAAHRDGVNVFYRIVEPRVHGILRCLTDAEGRSA